MKSSRGQVYRALLVQAAAAMEAESLNVTDSGSAPADALQEFKRNVDDFFLIINAIIICCKRFYMYKIFSLISTE